MRTDDDLRQIAIDIHAGRIFTDRNCPRQEDIPLVFPILHFMTQEQIDNLKEKGADLLFEYVSKASPRSINGMPMFFSMNYLTRDEAAKVWKYIKKIEESMNDLHLEEGDAPGLMENIKKSMKKED